MFPTNRQWPRTSPFLLFCWSAQTPRPTPNSANNGNRKELIGNYCERLITCPVPSFGSICTIREPQIIRLPPTTLFGSTNFSLEARKVASHCRRVLQSGITYSDHSLA